MHDFVQFLDCFHICPLNTEDFSAFTLSIILIRGHTIKLLQKSIPAIKNFIIILYFIL